MKKTRLFVVLSALILVLAVLGYVRKSLAAPNRSQTEQAQQAPSVASAVDREISVVEKLVTEAAEAMPEVKFNFSPESLNIPGRDG